MSAERSPLNSGLRFAILKRDGFTCQYCGRTSDDGIKLHVDHVIPVSRGGQNVPGNLVTSCEECNLGKSNNAIGEKIEKIKHGNIIRIRKKEILKDEVNEFINKNVDSVGYKDFSILMNIIKDKNEGCYRHIIGIIKHIAFNL